MKINKFFKLIIFTLSLIVSFEKVTCDVPLANYSQREQLQLIADNYSQLLQLIAAIKAKDVKQVEHLLNGIKNVSTSVGKEGTPYFNALLFYAARSPDYTVLKWIRNLFLGLGFSFGIKTLFDKQFIKLNDMTGDKYYGGSKFAFKNMANDHVKASIIVFLVAGILEFIIELSFKINNDKMLRIIELIKNHPSFVPDQQSIEFAVLSKIPKLKKIIS